MTAPESDQKAKKTWFQRRWVIGLLICVLVFELAGPVSMYRLRGRATARRVCPEMLVAVRREGDAWIVGALTNTTPQNETLYIYKPQYFSEGIWGLQREHRKWIMLLQYRLEDADYRSMLSVVGDYLRAVDPSVRNEAAIATVDELRTSHDSNRNGPNYRRSNWSVNPAGCLHLAMTILAATFLFLGIRSNAVIWIKARRLRRASLCSRCDYSLVGLPTRKCPECGFDDTVKMTP